LVEGSRGAAVATEAYVTAKRTDLRRVLKATISEGAVTETKQKRFPCLENALCKYQSFYRMDNRSPTSSLVWGRSARSTGVAWYNELLTSIVILGV
jgi:hypothetical protein